MLRHGGATTRTTVPVSAGEATTMPMNISAATRAGGAEPGREVLVR